MKIARALYEIQSIELDIIERTKRLKSVNAQLKNDKLLRQAKKGFAIAETALNDNGRLVKDVENQIEAVVEKRKATETRLYSGSVGNPKELQDMQMEMESLTRRQTQLEDQLLQLMMARDDVSQEMDDSTQILEETKGQHDKQQQSLLNEKTALSGEIERLMTKRKRALEKAPAEAMQTYDNMRKATGNRPVAVLRDRSCTICGIEQDGAVLAAIKQKDTLVNCNNCGRILLKM